MNLLRAESYLQQYGCSSTRLAEVYDSDDMLQSVLAVLFPDFEYPDYSHLTMEELRKRYAANPRPLPS